MNECNIEYQKNPNYKFSPELALKTIEKSQEYGAAQERLDAKIYAQICTSSPINLYDYNEKMIDLLEKEMQGNLLHVTQECSFIYHIHINTPHPELMETGSVDELLKIELYPTYHAFILEQYCNEEGIVFVRLYQSFLNEFTLLEYIEQKRYDEKDTGCLNLSELALFFQDLKGLLLCGNLDDLQEDKLMIHAKRIFNSPEDSDFSKLSIFRQDILTITGLSFRYITSQINPNEIKKHVEHLLIAQNPECS